MSSGERGRSHEDNCALLSAEIDRLVDGVRGGDPAAEVPSCPGWTLLRLLKHVGVVHRWVRHLVAERVTEPLWPREVPVAMPGDPGAYPDWLAEGGAELVAALRAADPGTPVWSWSARPDAGFWARRMLHETTVHRADAELALGRDPHIEAGTAADGVDEFLALIETAPWMAEPLRELGGAGEILHFHATDVPAAGDRPHLSGEWTITLSPGMFTWTHGHGKGDVAVRGPVSDLLLLLYGRREPFGGGFEVFGDRDLLARWLAKTAL
ncbi:maleylpyruvate isomerase family mycothiol-dependent enzyme [Planotetraspora kaengkrachanensis]|nr:maleylpyruvate isomerase family mycothiol-dependent enzyme [Planotetraspora kaengkrachanensis]